MGPTGFQHGVGESPDTRCTLEPLEGRRLLTAAYPVGGIDVSVVRDHRSELAASAGELYVLGRLALLRSDGSPQGFSTAFAGTPNSAFDWNGTLYFVAPKSPTQSRLFRLPPGAAAPIEILLNGTGPLPAAGAFVPAGNTLYLGANDVYAVDAGSSSARLVVPRAALVGVFKNRVYFSRYDESIRQDALWYRDLNTGQETLVRERLHAHNSLEVNGRLVIGTSDGVFSTDGSPGNLVLLKEFGGAEWLQRLGNGVIWIRGVTEGVSLLYSDGTPGGTVTLREHIDYNFGPPRDGAGTLVVSGDTAYFVARGDNNYQQLFSTRGPGTTRQITSLTSDEAQSGAAAGVAVVGNRIFFTARTTPGGFELWQSDGTVGNASKVPGFVPDSYPLEFAPAQLTAAGGSLFFTARLQNGTTRLWRYAVSPVALENGTLVVNGTDPAEGGTTGNDQIALAPAGPNIDVTVNGVAVGAFPAAAVTRIVVNALGGDDTLDFPDTLLTTPAGAARQLVYNASSGTESFSFSATDADETIVVSGDRIETTSAGALLRSVVLRGVDSLAIDAKGGADDVRIDGSPSPAVTLSGGAGDDQIRLNGLSGANLTLDGGAGDDSVRVAQGQLTSIIGSAALAGGEGVDQLTIDDSANDKPDAYTLSGASVSRQRPQTPVQSFAVSGFTGGVRLLAGTAPNVFNVSPHAATPFSVVGGSPNSVTPFELGDTLVLDPANVPGATLTRTGPGAGGYTFAGRMPVNFEGLEAVDDLAAPTVASALFLPSVTPHRLNVNFSEPLAAAQLTTAAFSITNLITGQAIPASAMVFDPFAFTFVGNRITLEFNGFSRGLLPDGLYRLTVLADHIRDRGQTRMAANHTYDFAVLTADADRDGTVGFSDLVALAQHYNTIGATYAGGDFNHDQRVNFQDLVMLAQRYNSSFTLPRAGSPASPPRLESDRPPTPGLPVGASPAVDAGPDRVARTGRVDSIDFSVTGDTPLPWSFSVDWGDGTAPTVIPAGQPATMRKASAAHGYAQAGTYPVTITASDGAGNSYSDSLAVRVGKVLVNAFMDRNGNGQHTIDEGPIAGRHVYIDSDYDGRQDQNEPGAVTDSYGQALFDGLADGIYPVRAQPLPGHLFSVADSDLHEVSAYATGGGFVQVGYTDRSIVRGSVFNDVDGDGAWDLGEPAMRTGSLLVWPAPWPGYLAPRVGGDIDPQGCIRIKGLLPGRYLVRYDPTGSTSQSFPAGGVGYEIVITEAAQIIQGLNFGFRQAAPATVRGTVFHDANGDGVQDAGEAGAPGFFVYLDADNDGALDLAEPTAATINNGTFELAELPAGTYTIRLAPRGGWEHSAGQAGYPVTLTPGQQAGGLIFGSRKTDFTPPTVLAARTGADARGTWVQLEISEHPHPLSLSISSIGVRNLGDDSRHQIGGAYDPLTRTLTYRAESVWVPAGNYELLFYQLIDEAGNSVTPYTLQFTVGAAASTEAKSAPAPAPVARPPMRKAVRPQRVRP
jgi:ELWxxDGT repeat protein